MMDLPVICEVMTLMRRHCNKLHMMTSSNGNIFRVTGTLCGEFTGPRWIPPHKGQWRGALMFSLICARINGGANNREAGDLRRHRTHYDVIVMNMWISRISRNFHFKYLDQFERCFDNHQTHEKLVGDILTNFTIHFIALIKHSLLFGRVK